MAIPSGEIPGSLRITDLDMEEVSCLYFRVDPAIGVAKDADDLMDLIEEEVGSYVEELYWGEEGDVYCVDYLDGEGVDEVKTLVEENGFWTHLIAERRAILSPTLLYVEMGLPKDDFEGAFMTRKRQAKRARIAQARLQQDD